MSSPARVAPSPLHDSLFRFLQIPLSSSARLYFNVAQWRGVTCARQFSFMHVCRDDDYFLDELEDLNDLQEAFHAALQTDEERDGNSNKVSANATTTPLLCVRF